MRCKCAAWYPGHGKLSVGLALFKATPPDTLPRNRWGPVPFPLSVGCLSDMLLGHRMRWKDAA